MVKKPNPKPKTRGWRATVEDERLVQELKARLGIKSDSDLVRMGLRALQREAERAA